MMRALIGRRVSAVVAAALIAGAVTVSGAMPVQAAEVPSAPLAFGAYAKPRNGQTERSAVEAYETQVGRKLAVVRVFETWDQAFPDTYHTWLKDSGHSIILSIKPTRSNGTRVTWPSISGAAVGSQVYNEMVAWAQKVKAYGVPIYITFNHEPEAGANTTGGTATDFIAAWRKWVDVFRAQGVTNAKFMWIMTDYSFFVATSDRRYAPKWYPGDGWVDAMGTDAYNWYTCRPGTANAWKSLQQIIDPFRAFGALHPDKALWLSEFATVEDSASAGRKSTWLTQATALFKQPGWDQFDGVLYFNATFVQGGKDVCLWYTDTTTTSLASYKTMGLDPFFNGPAFQDAVTLPDTVPPSAPGKPTATSTVSGRATVTWAAATDDRATSLTYSLYRDGGTTAVGTVVGGVTGTITLQDTGLVPGSIHTWAVKASDGTNTGPASATSDAVTIAGDGTPPSAPGQPTGTSTVAGQAALTWSAATDNLATSLTYSVYRDAGVTAVGTVVGGVTGSVSFTDTGLAAGSVHTWTVKASDGTNTGPSSPASDPVTIVGDVTPPSAPGKPAGTSTVSGIARLTWAAATDDTATSLTYSVYRDADPTAVGTVVGGVTGTISFDDTGLAPGSVHTWTVTASDGPNTGASSPASDPVTISAVTTGPTIVAQTDFTNGLTGWTGVSNLTIDNTVGSPTDEAPSLRVQASNQVATGRLALSTPSTSVCADFDFRATSVSSADKYAPLKLRSSSGASVGRIWISNTGSLRVRADVTGAEFATTSVVAPGTWHRLGLCTTIGTTGSLSLRVDGVTVGTWAANTGTSPVASVQLGDNDARTATANWDALVVTVP
ncbi:MAG: domain containing protein [Ilumatobacteraceae bacterium]|nr:domain containing protein [Ilumatobacteraceae bacterium]